jgi:hypothetical protein
MIAEEEEEEEVKSVFRSQSVESSMGVPTLLCANRDQKQRFLPSLQAEPATPASGFGSIKRLLCLREDTPCI